MKIELVSKPTEYDEFVKKNPSTFYQSSKHLKFLENILKINAKFIVARDNNEMVGVMPIFCKETKFGKVINSLPFFGSYGGVIGQKNLISNTTTYAFNEENILTFGTRRNRSISLTEYYDLIYEYKNDCLVANIHYKKNYYNDADIKPTEELFFSLTIVPFYTYSPNKMILNKDRID